MLTRYEKSVATATQQGKLGALALVNNTLMKQLSKMILQRRLKNAFLDNTATISIYCPDGIYEENVLRLESCRCQCAPLVTLIVSHSCGWPSRWYISTMIWNMDATF